MNKTVEQVRMRWLNKVAVGALALAVGFPALHVAAQDQAPPPPAAADQGPNGGPDAGAPPAPEPGYPVQGPPSQAPVNQAPDNQAAPPPSQPYPNQPYPNQPPGRQGYPNQPPPPQRRNAAPLPQTLVLPAGTVILARTTDWLSSDKNHADDTFTATLEQPLIANGWVVAHRGQTLTGRVVTAQKAPHGSGSSQLAVELADLTTVDGQVLAVHTQLMQSEAGRSGGRDAATVGVTTALGALIGGAAGGGSGAAIGAGAGAGAGVAGVLATRGRPTVIPAEALLTFRLQDPVSISTDQGQQAFHPAGQGDYGRDQDAYANRPPQRYVGGPYGGGPYGPGPYAAPYYAVPYGYAYPYPYSFGYGFYPGPLYFGYRGGFRGGFRR